MTRKRWTAQTEVTPSLIKFREKKKWQIALRRYLLERNPCVTYAPYFGLDIERFRKWIETQFTEELGWEKFGTNWQLEHIVPLTCFNFEDDHDLKLCWNFLNIRVEPVQKGKEKNDRVNLFMAKSYFKELYQTTGYEICRDMLTKIDQIESAETLSTTAQKEFIAQNEGFLKNSEGFTSYEFELLNSGREVEDVKKEADLIKKLGE